MFPTLQANPLAYKKSPYIATRTQISFCKPTLKLKLTAILSLLLEGMEIRWKLKNIRSIFQHKSHKLSQMNIFYDTYGLYTIMAHKAPKNPVSKATIHDKRVF